jgi:O-antigen ligase/Flp pilus assembly protein TadD
MHSRTLFRITTFLLYATVVATPLFYFARAVYPYGLAKSLFFQALIEFLFIAWGLLAWYEPKFRLSWTPLMKALAAVAVVLFLTSMTGVDPWRSFWSTQERAVGAVMLFHVFALIVVVRSLAREIRVERFLAASLATSVVVGGIALLQLFVPNLLLNEGVGSRPGSTFGNPAFLAGYLGFNVFLAAYFVLQWFRAQHGGARPPRYGVLLPACAGALLLIAIFVTETRGDILGIVAGIFSLTVLFAVAPPDMPGRILGTRRFYVWICIAMVALGILFIGTRGSAVWSVIPGLGRFREISLESSSLLPRRVALEAAWKGFMERPFLGWGWENYNIVFNKHYDPRTLEANYQETRFDKPHNFVAEYLVTGGALLFLAVVALFGAFFREAWKLRGRLFGQVMIAAGIAYAARNFFVFETIGPLLMWALALGAVDGEYAREGGAHPHPAVARRIRAFPLCAGAFLALAAVYFINILSLVASHYQFLGFSYFLRNRPQAAIENFRRALDAWSPYTWNLKRDYATAVAEAYFYNPGKVPPEEALRAVRAMEEAAQEHPLDAYGHYALVDMYNQVSEIAPETLLPKAEAEAAKALALSPNRQEVYFSLAKTKSLQGKNEEALAILRKTIELNPKIPDAHFYYGLIAYTLGDAEAGYAEIKKALALGRQWKRHHEPRVVGNFFADSGHLDEAVDLYATAIKMEPGDLEARAKLGIAYFIRGDKAQAKHYLEEVNRRADLRESPSYDALKPILDALGIIPHSSGSGVFPAPIPN